MAAILVSIFSFDNKRRKVISLKFLRLTFTLLSGTFAGRKFRGCQKPQNCFIFAELNFAVEKV